MQLQDANGNPVRQAGSVVTAAIATGPAGSTLASESATTDASGLATFSGLAISGPTGSYTLSFVAAGLTPAVSGTITVGAGVATQLTLTTQPSTTAQSGVAFARQPVVQLRDAAGNAVSQAGVTVTAAIATGGGTLGGTLTAATSGTGVATFTNLSISGTIGDRTLSFSATGLTLAVSGTITVGAGAATQLTLTTEPSPTAQSGVPFARQPVEQLRDGAGNAVSQAGVTVTAAIATGGGTLGGTLTAATSASGVATFTNLSLSGTAGDRTLSFSATGLAPAVSGTITVGAGVATHLTLTTQPSATAQSGVAFAQQPAAQLRDAAGNAVSQAGVTVTAAIATGGGSLSGTATAATDGGGVASFTNLAISGTAGDRTLSFSATGLTQAVSGTITVSAGAASQLTLTTQPSATAQGGVAFARQPVVQLRDGAGNAVSQAGVTVTATIASGAGGATLASATATTGSTGVATFSGLAITGTAGTYTLSFGASGFASVVSNTITLAAGAAAQLTLTTPPSAAPRSGVAFGQQPVVQLRDAAGNPVSQAGVTVTATIASAPAGGAGTVANASTTTAASGAASFSGLTLTGTAGSYTLSFGGSGLTPVISGTLTLSAGAAVAIANNSPTTQSAPAGTAVASPPAVIVTDASGNPVAGVDVTFAVTAGNGSLSPTSPTTVVTNASGTATVTSWTLGNTVGTNTVTATASGLTGSSVTFTATGTAGTATKLVITTAPSSSAQSGVTLARQPVLQLQDANSNPVNESGVVVTATVAPAGATPGNATATTGTSGTATFSGLTLTGTAGAYTLSFAATGLPPVTSGPITLGAGAATELSLTTQPSGTAQSGVAFAQQPVVQVRDGAGNAVSQSGVTVTAAIASGGGALGGTATATTNTAGAATFTNLSIAGTVGPRTLGFGTPGLSGATSAAVSLTAGPATQIAAHSVVTQSATAGTAVANPPSVLVTDASANPVSGVSVTFAVASGDGTVNPATPVATGADGIAAVVSWTLGPTAGANTLSANAAGLAGSSVTFTATATVGPPASLVKSSGDPLTGQVGTTLATPHEVLVRDAGANPVSGVRVDWRAATGGGSVNPSFSTTDVNGHATTTRTLGVTPGTQTTTATATLQSGPATVTFTITATIGGASRMTKNGGDLQKDTVGATLPVPLSVSVTDDFNNPVGNVTIGWSVIDGGGQVNPPSSSTNAQGIASLLEKLRPFAVELIVMESTGGLERKLSAELAEAGHPIAIVNPRRSRRRRRRSRLAAARRRLR